MPIVTRPDGSPVTDPATVDAIVATLGLSLRSVWVPRSAALDDLLRDRHLSDARICAILDDVEPVLGQDHLGSDVVALFDDTPGLDRILAAFARPHRHGDAETRLILAGGGAFGFVLSDGAQVEIAVGPGDLVEVPSGVEHWFRLDEARRLVAVRLFHANPDWRAEYTGTHVHFPQTRTLYD